MRLYSGLSTDFIRDSVHNRIGAKLKDAFFRQFRYQPAPSEVSSWQNSLRAVSQVIDNAKLHDHGILLEYQLPMTRKRLDCMICGQDAGRCDRAGRCLLGRSREPVVGWPRHLAQARIR